MLVMFEYVYFIIILSASYVAVVGFLGPTLGVAPTLVFPPAR